MRSFLAPAAFAASLLSFAVLLAIGAFLAGFEETGARGTGLLLALSAAAAFGAALFLIRAPRGYFRRKLRQPLGVVVTLAAAAPAVALAAAALVFTGLPLGTRLPLVDWPVFTVGLVFALGVLCILALGYARLAERPGPGEPASTSTRDPATSGEVRVRRV